VITGTHFLGARSVEFGESNATIVGSVSDTKITGQPPPHAPGEVHVTVSTPRGSSEETNANSFTYE
jgi:IPT/TIG domain